MGHDITNEDALFSVREMPWHGLGTVLTDYPTRAEAQKIAHPWEPVSEPLYRAMPTFDADGQPTTVYEKVSGFVANSRSDTAALLGVTSDSFELVTNAEMYDIAEALESEAGGDVRFETGGSLQGGRKVWLMVRMKEPLAVPGDPLGATVPYYSLQNSHDGSGAFRGQATVVRVVCANTSHFADLDAQTRGTEFVFRHTKNVREHIEEAKEALAGWRAGLLSWQQDVAFLRSTSITDEQATEFIERFIPMPTHGLITERVTNNVTTARGQLRDVLDASVTNEFINRSAFGLIQAASEWSEHIRPARTAETRFKRAVLDRNGVMRHAQELALDVAGVAR